MIRRTCALIALALVTACTGGPDFSALGRDGSVLAVAQRALAPDLAGSRLGGGPAISTAALRGKVVVVNLWGSWCGPCQEEAAALGQVATDTAASGVSFVGVDTRDVDTKALAFVTGHKLPYPSMVDTDGSLSATWRPFPAVGTPITVVLDRHGKAAARFLGRVSYTDLSRVVDQLAAESV